MTTPLGEVAELDIDATQVLTNPPRQESRDRLVLGRRAPSHVSRPAGRYARHRVDRRVSNDVAIDATLRAAAVRHVTDNGRVVVDPDDLRWKIRHHRAPLATVLVVDNSYSLRAEHVLEQTKGIVDRLLADAAQHGDKVALVAFRGGLPEATVALPLTKSLRRARQRLEHIPLAGRTPLADALRRGHQLLHQERLKRAGAVPLLVVVTDGLPTAALRPGGDPVADTLTQARALPRGKIGCVVADASPTGTVEATRSCASALATASRGMYVRLEELIRKPETRK